MQHYKIIEQDVDKKEKFENIIEHKLGKGWVLHGETRVVQYNRNSAVYIQAMVKKD